MNPLNNFWIMIGNNSGQLQTFLAVIGLVLAVMAALYAKKQIKLSQDQRQFELKLSILNAAYECKDLIYEFKKKHSALKSEFSKLLHLHSLSLDSLVTGFDYNYHEYFNLQLNLLKTPEEVISQLITEIRDENKNPSLDQLETYLKHVINAKGQIYSAHSGCLRQIEELKQLNNIFSQLEYPHN